MDSIGKRLKKARTNKGLNQIEVYQKTGINNKTLSRYENDGTEPDADSLRRLAEVYDVTVDWIVGHNNAVKIIDDQTKNAALEIYARLPQEEKKLIDDMIMALMKRREE